MRLLQTITFILILILKLGILIMYYLENQITILSDKFVIGMYLDYVEKLIREKWMRFFKILFFNYQ